MAIVCALPIELAAIRVVLDEEYAAPEIEASDSTSYTFGRIAQHNVVVASLPCGVYGQVSTTDVAKDLQRTFPDIENVALVGIAGGCPDPSSSSARDVRLGDVVVSFGEGAPTLDSLALAQCAELKNGLRVGPPGKWWLGGVSKLKSDAFLGRHPELHDARFRSEKLKAAFARPGADFDKLLPASDGKTETKAIVRKDRADATPKVFYGPIASLESPLRDARLRDVLSQGGFLCADSCAGAVAHVARSYVVVRGICDYCDASADSKQWHGFAAASASSFAALLLAALQSRPAMMRVPVDVALAARPARSLEVKEHASVPRKRPFRLFDSVLTPDVCRR